MSASSSAALAQTHSVSPVVESALRIACHEAWWSDLLQSGQGIAPSHAPHPLLPSAGSVLETEEHAPRGRWMDAPASSFVTRRVSFALTSMSLPSSLKCSSTMGGLLPAAAFKRTSATGLCRCTKPQHRKPSSAPDHCLSSSQSTNLERSFDTKGRTRHSASKDIPCRC